jgi:oxygen-independent coproporphyrinogen-3 oxidase
MERHSVYVHIPFCRHRCAYCDFNTYAGLEDLIPDYIAALKEEIRISVQRANANFTVHTIFFGGGTPSLLQASAIGEIIQTLDDVFDLDAEAEISLEANPGTLSPAALRDLRLAGVNRLSLGMQSAYPGELAFLEREHQYEDVISAVKWARQAGFDNLSLDLIFGLPGQRPETWNGSLTLAVDLAPEHLSLYALTLEPGTPMHKWAVRGLIPEPDPDLAAEMYEQAGEKLAAAGYVQYEISNWAKTAPDAKIRNLQSTIENPTWACRHNLQYWRNQPYFGFGAGAHGFIGGFRTSNILAPKSYIRRFSQPADAALFPRTPVTVGVQPIDLQTEMSETMMMGLRLTREGVSDACFQARFGVSLREIYADQIDKFTGWGLLEWVGDHLRLTERGYLLGNQVFSEFV